MRAVFLVVLLAACTPDIVSGAYLCGPNAACPGDLVCNGPDNFCVLQSTAEPFSCEGDFNTEPDDTAATAHVITGLNCLSVPYTNSNCMLEGDTEDWFKLTPPDTCASVGLHVVISYTIAFERLSLELWNLDTNTQVAVDKTCPNTGENGEELRCLDESLTPGGNYGIKVQPTQEGNCGGNCAYNRYTLRVQLSTPG
jgi:hypothetical protein